MKLNFGITALVLFITGTACRSSERDAAESRRNDVLTISTPAEPDALVPLFVQSTQGKQVADLIFDHLAQPAGASVVTVGDQQFAPQLARSWKWAADSLSIAFDIHPDARWHDGRPVTADDVRFSLALFRNTSVASPIAAAFDGIDSISAPDAHTAIVWWSRRHPEQFFQVAYNLAVLPKHLLETVSPDSIATSSFARKPIGSGQYRFEQWIARSQVVVQEDSVNYRGRPSFSRLIWLVSNDPTAASMRVIAGEADMLEQLRDDAYEQVSRSITLRTVEYGSYDYAYMLFNNERRVAGDSKLFANRDLRRAITQSLDRNAIVQNALGPLGRVALGPFTRSEAAVDTAMRQITFDSVSAYRALDSLGWKRDAAGVRRKNGKVLSLEILVPSSSGTRKRIAVLLQEQLRVAGIQSEVTAVEPGVFFSRLEKGDFDVALNMWRAVPGPNSLREVWSSRPASAAAPNFSRYSNRSFDALIDSAARSFDAEQRTALVRRAHQMIVDDAAAVWLYEPRNIAALNRQIEPAGMRADAWWAALASWKRNAAAVATR